MKVTDAVSALVDRTISQGTVDLPDIERGRQALASTVGLGSVSEAECPAMVTELLTAVDLPDDDACRAVVMALRDEASQLRWVDPYLDRPDLAELRAGYFVTTLVGHPVRETALAFSEQASVFLTVQGPGIMYPPHSHVAPELYCALAGTADWKKGDGPFVSKPPGSWMVHGPWDSHAMRTRDEPLVSLAFWTDNLDCAPVIDDAKP